MSKGIADDVVRSLTCDDVAGLATFSDVSDLDPQGYIDELRRSFVSHHTAVRGVLEQVTVRLESLQRDQIDRQERLLLGLGGQPAAQRASPGAPAGRPAGKAVVVHEPPPLCSVVPKSPSHDSLPLAPRPRCPPDRSPSGAAGADAPKRRSAGSEWSAFSEIAWDGPQPGAASVGGRPSWRSSVSEAVGALVGAARAGPQLRGARLPRRPIARAVRFQVWLRSRILGHDRSHWLLLLLSGVALLLCGGLAWSLSGGNEDFGTSFYESMLVSYMLFIDPGTQTGIDASDPMRLVLVAMSVSVLGFIWNLTFLGTLVELIRETLKRYKQIHRHLHVCGHLLILGWNDTTFFLLNELLSAEQNAGFHGARRGFLGLRRRRLQIVVLAERPEIEMAQEVRMYFHGTGKDTRCIHFWEGDPADRVELMKVSAPQAENILVTGSDRRGADQEVIRTLLSLAALPGGPPGGQVFGEIRHPEKTTVIGTLLQDAQAIVARTEVNRVLVLRALVPSVGYCMKEMTTFKDGTSELYLRPVPAELVGWNFFDAAQLFTHSVVCGVKAGDDPPKLMPQAKTELREGDLLLVLARCRGDADMWLRQEAPNASSPSSTLDGSEGPDDARFRRAAKPLGTLASATSTADVLQEDGQVKLGPSVEGPRVILMIGCPHDFPNFLEIVDGYLASGSTVHLLSMRDMQWRDATLKAYVGDAGVSVDGGFGLKRVKVHHYVGDSTRKGDLRRLPLAEASCAIILADRADGEDSIDVDTRTLTTAIALKAVLSELRDKRSKCKIATEILDVETEKVISINGSVRATCSFMYTRSIEAGLLAMAVAQPTSFAVVKQLLAPRSTAGYIVAVPVGRHVTGSERLSFLDLRDRLWRRCRGILLGWRRQADRYPNVNPADKTELFDWEESSADELIVMRRSDGA